MVLAFSSLRHLAKNNHNENAQIKKANETQAKGMDHPVVAVLALQTGESSDRSIGSIV